MNEPQSASDGVVEDSETYRHDEHGCVEVTGIWHRTRRLETTRDVDRRNTIVVRFVPGADGRWIDELAEPLDDFLDEID
ncbi:hypothetical protein EA472_01875 [Natrarchaeobius oligotrophus]|uniref:Uncharacterized protein n=2 Tax=Natrarchaeobius TaxID=2501796 RepID=A0A3N6MNT4_NATCH|nr:hypothetical protein EA472_01875 [Natrarchaeobius chitinivorans]